MALTGRKKKRREQQEQAMFVYVGGAGSATEELQGGNEGLLFHETSKPPRQPSSFTKASTSRPRPSIEFISSQAGELCGFGAQEEEKIFVVDGRLEYRWAWVGCGEGFWVWGKVEEEIHFYEARRM